jgi:hypothetical protein
MKNNQIPVTVRLNMLKNSIVRAINEAELPYYIVGPMLKNLTDECQAIMKREEEDELETYKKMLEHERMLDSSKEEELEED